MRFLARRAVPALCLALAAACGGGSSKGPDPTSSQASPPSGQGSPTPPSDPGTSGGSGSGTSGGSGSGTSGGSGSGTSGGTGGSPPSPTSYVVRVDCSAVNDFGYIGWAKGDLAIGGRTADGGLSVKGTLKLRYALFGGAETDRDVQVDGTVEKSGQTLQAKVVSGANDLDSVFFVFQAGNPFSAISGPNGSPAYQTDCGASSATIPHGSDLLPQGELSFVDLGNGTVEAHVNVVNDGDQPASGTTGHAQVAGTVAAAELHRASDGSLAALGSGENGYLKVVLPAGVLSRCTSPEVVLDVDRSMQSGDPDPFANDRASVVAPCMTWSRPMSADALGFDPDPILVGKTLGGIVGGAEVGRKDGNLCSHCHYDGSGNTYSPPVLPDGSITINPTDVIGGTSWAAPNGLASRFLTNPINKPDYLKAIVKQWLDDGARP